MKEIVVDEYLIKKVYEDSQKDCMWRICSLKDSSNEFVVHVSHSGEMYITHFHCTNIPFKVRVKLFKELCRYLKECGYNLSIKIVNRNQALKDLCLASGFRYKSHGHGPKKSYGIRHDKDFTVYYLPK